MSSKQILSSSIPTQANGNPALTSNYWILQTELLSISNMSGFPNATFDQVEELEEATSSLKLSTRKPMQDRNQIGNVAQSENVKSGRKLLDRGRMKVSKLKIPSRRPISPCPVSQEKASPSQILDFLYLGNSRDASNLESLENLGVTHIINATHDLPNYFEDKGRIKYLRVPVEDSGTADLMPHFNTAIDFIDGAVQSKGRVLVHCREGVSRSASLVAAYLMAHSNLSLMHTLAVVSHTRPIICPNINFLGQLDKFHQSLQHKTKSYLHADPNLRQSVEQQITRRFRDYQAEASKEDLKPAHSPRYFRRDSSRIC